MALVNHAKKEINAKLVFFGPPMAGKATNLNHIYRRLKPEFRGSFKSMNIEKDRMLFFDFVPSGQAAVDEYTVRFHVYTLIGEVASSAAWKMVLKGVDGVVFVADSSPERMAANQASLKELEGLLESYGKTVREVPCVLQANRQDLDGAAPAEELRRALNLHDLPLFPAVANKGEGVLESIFALVKVVLKNLRDSGLALARETDQLRSVVPEPSEASATAVAEPAPAAMPVPPAAEETTGVELEIAGEPVLLDDGRLRLPLGVKCGGRLRNVSLTIAISLESE